MPVTAAELLAFADRLEADALALLRAGDKNAAADLATAAEANRVAAGRLTSASHAGNVQDVTHTQKRRARAVAKSRAAKSEDPRRIAIAARWGSQAKAARGAGITPGALVFYLRGDHPTPAKVAKFFAVDPGLPASRATWPGGIVD